MPAMIDRQRWLGIMSNQRRCVGAALLRGGARVLALGYGLAVVGRNAAYDLGIRRARRAHAPVVSVGNLTTGGTGKTPMVMHVVSRLRASGRAPAILMRGYMPAAGQPSDEAALYRRRLPGVPVVTQADRVAGVAAIRRDHPEVDVIVLDDGFQHRRLARDLDVVLIDATEPWGYGHLLPRGLLREPRTSLRRADAVVLTHGESVDATRADRLSREIERRHGRPPLARAAHRWARVLDADGATVASAASPPAAHDAEGLGADRTNGGAGRRRRVVAFCGLGNPTPFFHEAAQWFEVVERYAFDDHQRYDARFAGWLAERLRAAEAEAGLTTEKDWVRLEPHLGEGGPAVWRATLELTLTAGGEALERALDEVVGAWA